MSRGNAPSACSRARRRASVAIAVAAIALGPAMARAQEPPAASSEEKGRSHEGLYVRGALGGGGLWARRTYAPAGGPESGTTTRGAAGTLELTIGGTPAPGFVVAGSLFGALVLAPTTRTESASTRDAGTLALDMIAATVDWYPRPRGGFHLGGSLGVALLRSSEQSERSASFDARGPALALAGGYDVWTGEHLSVGGLARLLTAAVGDKGPRAPESTSYDTVYAITVGLSVLYQLRCPDRDAFARRANALRSGEARPGAPPGQLACAEARHGCCWRAPRRVHRQWLTRTSFSTPRHARRCCGARRRSPMRCG